jgi:hypothetical protein
MSDDTEQKQLYLRNEIIDQGYSPDEFSNFISNEYGDKGLDVESWSFEDLKKIVTQFKSKYQLQNNPKPQTQNIQEENQNEPVPNPETEKKQEQQNITEEIEKTEPKPQKVEIKSLEEPLADFSQTLKSIKLEPNELSDINNLKVIISKPQRVKSGLFSQAYYQYNVETKPIGYNVVRKVSDFTFLHETLPLINNIVFNPVLPHFEFGLKDDSPKKMLYIQNYMNSLLENRFFRTLPIVYEFLKMSQVQWDALRSKKYNKMKPNNLGQMPTLDGEIVININKKEDEKGIKIKDEINKKIEAFNELNNVMDEILALIEKLSNQFNLLGNSLNNLKKSYKDNDILKEFFERLNKLSNTWQNNYVKEKEVLKDGFKYFFKFMGKENTQFLKKYDEFKSSRTEYFSKYEKLKKMPNKAQKDIALVDKLKRYYGIQLYMINKEYFNLVERQANRCKNEFMNNTADKEIMTQNLNNCIKLLEINSKGNIEGSNENKQTDNSQNVKQ